jgi:hypothetical protein
MVTVFNHLTTLIVFDYLKRLKKNHNNTRTLELKSFPPTNLYTILCAETYGLFLLRLILIFTWLLDNLYS